MYGGDGNDLLDSGFVDGNFLCGGTGNDEINVYGGNNLLFGDDGNDTLSSGSNSSLDGGNGNDTLSGSDNSSLDGGNGNDFLLGVGVLYNSGTEHIDTLTGGAGRDTFGITYWYEDFDPLSAGISDYALVTDFQAGQDFLQLTGAKTNYFLAASPNGLPTGTAIFFNKPGAELDELVAIVESGLDLNDSYFIESGNDTFYGTDEADSFNAGQDDDLLYGYAGDDSLIGEQGNDTLDGGNGNDSLFSGDGNDNLAGGTGNDSLNGGDGDDTLNGTNFGYPIDSGAGEIDTLTGGAGRDKFVLGQILPGGNGSITRTLYYDDSDSASAGIVDYALINDFDSNQDVVQLLGTPADYILGSSLGIQIGTGIYVNKPNTEPDELIAVVQGVEPSSLSLTGLYFGYVTNVS